VPREQRGIPPRKRRETESVTENIPPPAPDAQADGAGG
jgi:hypothetical protein